MRGHGRQRVAMLDKNGSNTNVRAILSMRVN